jgi:hypothetical protein
MPCQRRAIREAPQIVWGRNPAALKLVILPSVLELLLDAAAHLELEFRRDGDIARVKQAVNVASQ